jgi:2,3-dihydroxybiphenyl 1,2-dioxygenase
MHTMNEQQSEASSIIDESRVRELSHIVIDSDDVDAWEKFATVVLGMNIERTPTGLLLKMDSQPYRFIIRAADRNGVAVVAWEAQGAAHLAEIDQQLRKRDRNVMPLLDRTTGGRRIKSGISFLDDQDIIHEVFDAIPAAETPFQPGDVSGYVTGNGGVGHIVFIDNVARCDEVFLDSFRMTLREDITTKVGGKGHFYGCNPRHHSAAAVDGAKKSVMHIMLEMNTVDDVGCALDRAIAGGWTPRTGLGRHRTDHMFSFYIPTPGGFDFELGCGGLLVDDATWSNVKESSRLRVWGHAGIASAAGKSHD